MFFDLAGMPVTVAGTRTLAPIAGRIAALRGLSQMLRDRKQQSELRRISAEEMLARMEPVPHPMEVLRRQRRLKEVTQAKQPTD